jgi:hypothetical protein
MPVDHAEDGEEDPCPCRVETTEMGVSAPAWAVDLRPTGRSARRRCLLLAHPMLSLGQFMSRKARLWSMTILVTCGLLGVAIPNFIRARQCSATKACINNLRQIEAAKRQRELEACTTNIQSDGFLRIESYIDRLLRSPKESSAVVVTTADCPFALLVKQEGFRTIVSIGPDPPDRPLNRDEDTKIRELFSRRGMTPFREVASANSLYDHGRYGIEFQISGDSKAIARFCVSVFTNLYGATDQGGLSFTTFGL